ncbi:MAG: hypothetical protein MI741_22090, partial [Rhodospirillales bacterium]|nr:hypothetical protein [Rhodospirillales bacterium]
LRDKVHATVKAILDQRLSSHSLYVRKDDSSYLIVMSGATAREAQLRCRIISNEITERLAGRDNESQIVDLHAAEVDAAGNLSLHDVLPMQDMLEQFPQDVSDKARSVEALDPGYTRDGIGTGLEDIKFIYRPMLAVRTKVLSTFMSLPIRQVHQEFFLSGYAVLGQNAEPPQHLALDRLTVHHVGRDLHQLIAKGGKSLLALPVHYETLADNRTRTAYLSLCASEFRGMGDRVVFELVSPPDGIPQVRLAELVSLLRPHSRAVIARFPVTRRNFEGFRISGLHAVGIDLYNNATREENLMRDIDEFAQVANKNNLKTFAMGVRSISLYTAVVAAGYDYAAGHALTSVAESPENACVFRMDSPYHAVLDGPRGNAQGKPTFSDEDDLLNPETA